MASLVAYWPLHTDAKDRIGGHDGQPEGVEFVRGGQVSAARFGGRGSVIRVADAPKLRFSSPTWTVSVWMKIPAPMTGVFGDILSKFDPANRCGINLYAAGSSGAYCSMGDSRHLHFGIDDGYWSGFQDCGRPLAGNSLVTALTAFAGELFCGTADAVEPRERAQIFRYQGGTEWVSCGRLGDDLSVSSVFGMIVHENALYAATGTWDWKKCYDTSLRIGPPHVFRYVGEREWQDLGAPSPTAKRILTMASFDGHLYAGVDKNGGGQCHRLVGDTWEDCGGLLPDNHCECLLPVGGELFGTTHTGVYRYRGARRWERLCESVCGITQTHSLALCDGKLTCGTWPQGYVIQEDGRGGWTDIGRLGLPHGITGDYQCNEVMDISVYNGKMYTGVIPKAQLYRYESERNWTLLGSAASRPDGDWRSAGLESWCRITSFAQYRGRLYMSTGSCRGRHEDVDPEKSLGRVLSCQAGLVASYDHDTGREWTHLTAQRDGRKLRLFVGDELVSEAADPSVPWLHVDNAMPLKIGNGAQGAFQGMLRDLSVHDGLVAPKDCASISADKR
jgi:hypothetical protein